MENEITSAGELYGQDLANYLYKVYGKPLEQVLEILEIDSQKVVASLEFQPQIAALLPLIIMAGLHTGDVSSLPKDVEGMTSDSVKEETLHSKGNTKDGERSEKERLDMIERQHAEAEFIAQRSATQCFVEHLDCLEYNKKYSIKPFRFEYEPMGGILMHTRSYPFEFYVFQYDLDCDEQRMIESQSSIIANISGISEGMSVQIEEVLYKFSSPMLGKYEIKFYIKDKDGAKDKPGILFAKSVFSNDNLGRMRQLEFHPKNGYTREEVYSLLHDTSKEQVVTMQVQFDRMGF